jgi:hypothetical protein
MQCVAVDVMEWPACDRRLETAWVEGVSFMGTRLDGG